MQRISTDQLKPGMVLARSLFGMDGNLLLSADIELTQAYIERLKYLDISSVYIQNKLLEHTDIPEVVKEETRRQYIANIHKMFRNFQIANKVNVKQLKSVAKDIINEVILNRNTMIHLTDIRTHDDYTFGHSVNVCVLSVLLGVSMDYSEAKLRQIALGALLHDIGKMHIEKSILNKPGSLAESEWKVIKEHPADGYQLLKKQSYELPVPAMCIIYQHHEKYDGSGYPQGLKGSEIHEFARIVAIADVYDALTSDRPYRKGLLPHQAYEILLAGSGTHFDPEILRKFISHIAIYPIGSIVKLCSGEIGIIVDVTQGIPWRPKVKLLMDAEGIQYDETMVIDLTKNLTAIIEKVFTAEEATVILPDAFL